MAAENSFGRLLRASPFARFDRSIRKVYQAPASHPNASLFGTDGQARPLHFGFKMDMPPRITTTACQAHPAAVIVEGLEAEFGQAQVIDARDRAQAYRIFAEAKQAMATGSRIPTRFLNRTKEGNGGYCMGVGGLVALLPSDGLPEDFRPNHADMKYRKAYWAYVRSAQYDAKGKPRLILSIKKPS